MLRKYGIIDWATLLATVGVLGYTIKVFIEMLTAVMVQFVWPF